jgi:hypothetical protein
MMGVTKIAIASAMLAVAASAQSAPQCGTAKIFIDPGLAPHRPQVDRPALENLLALRSGGWGSEEDARQLLQLYLNQGQPIQVPFGNGVGMIHPANPCIQQYIGP